MSAQQQLFDAAESQKRKRVGMRLAEHKYFSILNLVRRGLRYEAQQRDSRTVTSDDAHRLLAEGCYPEGSLGNAMGSVFAGEEWECVGWVASKRPAAHGRQIRVWRLK